MATVVRYAADVVTIFVVAGLAGWWFSVTILPIVYGLPRAASMALRGRARWTGCAWCIGAPVVWSIVFAIIAVTLAIFFPWLVAFLRGSGAFVVGQWVGVGWSALYCLTAAGRRDLDADFMGNMSRFLTPRGEAEFEARKRVAALLEYQGACHRDARRVKAVCETLLRVEVGEPEQRAAIRSLAERCDVILRGDDVFTEDEVRLLEKMGRDFKAMQPGIDETIRETQALLTRKTG